MPPSLPCGRAGVGVEWEAPCGGQSELALLLLLE